MIKLVTIPKERYADYRYELIFKAHKWDPQYNDQSTIARHVLMIDRRTAEKLDALSEQLSTETIDCENRLLRHLPLALPLALPKKIYGALKRSGNYDPAQHIRVMRFDLHPSTQGWSVSEVNSDVPCGYAESSAWPAAAAKLVGGTPWKDPAERLAAAFAEKTPAGGMIALVHCTAYAEDRQVVVFLAEKLREKGLNTVFAAPDHIRFNNKKAECVQTGFAGKIDGMFRLFPVEWLRELPKNANWRGFFDTVTPSCNHPAVMLTQAKRLPLVWGDTDADMTVFKQYLPETVDPRRAKTLDGAFIYKPNLGRVGEGITVSGTMPQKEIKKIERAVRRHPKSWIAQKLFQSVPVTDENGTPFHLCLGAFTVNGKGAGFYARIAPKARIEAGAADIPVLIE